VISQIEQSNIFALNSASHGEQRPIHCEYQFCRNLPHFRIVLNKFGLLRVSDRCRDFAVDFDVWFERRIKILRDLVLRRMSVISAKAIKNDRSSDGYNLRIVGVPL
jgi:hypothetical protein